MTNGYVLIAIAPALMTIIIYLLLKIYLIYQTRAQIMNKLTDDQRGLITLPNLHLDVFYIALVIMIIVASLTSYTTIDGGISKELKHERLMKGIEDEKSELIKDFLTIIKE